MGQERQVVRVAVLQKAYICPYRDGSPVYGKKFHVQFNPSELSIDEAIGVSESEQSNLGEEIRKLLEGSKVGWQHSLDSASARNRRSSLTLSVTLFFNTMDDLYQKSYEDVRKYIKRLYPYTNRLADNSRKIEQLFFSWGSIGVAGTLNRMHVNYTMFAPDGTPVRAQAELSIVGNYYGEETDAESVEDDIAQEEFRDPAQWRDRESGTENPRK